MRKLDREAGRKAHNGDDGIIHDHVTSAVDCSDETTIAFPVATRLHEKLSWKKAFISAATVFSIATAAHAGELSDTKSQSEQLHKQNQLLTKRIVELEKRLRKLEEKPAKQPVLAARPADSANSTAADYKKSSPPNTKSLPFVADDGSLTYHGITLYGAVDMGLAYQTHGAPLSNSAGFGLAYLISKNSNGSYFGAAPNALSASNIGLKGTQELFPGLSGVFNLQTSFLPTSGRLSDGLGSIVQNNGLPPTLQTTFADSSKDGQALNTNAYAGLSSPTYGTLTYGWQNSLTLDGVIAYDPMSGSGAFSVIGFQGATAGGGDTENARLSNSLKYRVALGPYRAAVAYQFSSNGDGSRNIIQGQLGVDYLGVSFDAIYSHVNDAISAAPLAVGFTPSNAQLANAGAGLVAGTVSDNTSLMLLARYSIGPVKLYAGYENIHFANPDTPLLAGSTIIGGYTLGTVNNTAFANKKELQVFWAGAKYAVRSDIDLIGAFYHEQQNSFGVISCSDASLSTCSGQLDAVSFVVDYRFAKRWDAYAGAMYSQVRNGMANGFLNRSTIDPTVGLRFQF
jgi:predicted porin